VLSGRDTTLDAAMGVMEAKTVEQAIDAAQSYIAPAQNLTLVPAANSARFAG